MTDMTSSTSLLMLFQNIKFYFQCIKCFLTYCVYFVESEMLPKVRCKLLNKMNVLSAKGIKRKQIKSKAKKKLRAGLSEKENNNKLSEGGAETRRPARSGAEKPQQTAQPRQRIVCECMCVCVEWGHNSGGDGNVN